MRVNGIYLFKATVPKGAAITRVNPTQGSHSDYFFRSKNKLLPPANAPAIAASVADEFGWFIPFYLNCDRLSARKKNLG